MSRYLYALVILCAWTAGAVLYGEHRVQSKWDLERARQQTIAALARETDETARKAIEDKHKKDVEYAKSQAGRVALAAWLKSHGLLPDGSPVSGSGGCQANCTAPPDGRSDTELGPADRIEEFAGKCRDGARMNAEWREWAVREGLSAGE